MCTALNKLMKEELDAREAQGMNKLEEAILAIRNGVEPSEIKKKYGEVVFNKAQKLA